MKEIKIERKAYDIIWESFDGNRFQSREECEKYENSARAVVKQKFLKLVVASENEYSLFNAGSDDNIVYAIRMPKEEDMNTVLQLYYLENPYVLEEEEYAVKLKQRACDMVSEAYEYKDILFVGENYDGEIYFINTRLDIIDRLKSLDKKKKS